MPFNRGGVSGHFAGSRLRFENKGGHGDGKSGGKEASLRFQMSAPPLPETYQPYTRILWRILDFGLRISDLLYRFALSLIY